MPTINEFFAVTDHHVIIPLKVVNRAVLGESGDVAVKVNCGTFTDGWFDSVANTV